jgi:fluoride exporter
MTRTLYVALGGALGSVLRYWLSGWVASKAGAPMWGTLAINVVGSFLIGVAAGWNSTHDAVRLFVMVGILGGFTTFSAFSLQTLGLANVALSIVLCLLGVWLGYLAGRTIS